MSFVGSSASTNGKGLKTKNPTIMQSKAICKNNTSYELFAPRTADQVARLSRIAVLTAGPTSLGLDEDKDIKTPTVYAGGASILQAMSPWDPSSTEVSLFEEEGKVPTKIAFENAIHNSDHLTSILKHTTSLRLALRASINIAEDISNRHAELIRHSGELSAAADRLQGEQEILSCHAEEIGIPLKHYDAVDNVGILVGVLFKGKTVVRGLAKVKVDNDNFTSILDQIDDAVDFFARESGGREALEAEIKRERRSGSKDQFESSGSVEYYRRSLALQEAALFLIREAIVDRISATTAQVSSALNISKTPIAADKLEASLIYTRYYGISSRSNRLLSFVRKRLHRGEAYHNLLQLCRTTYCHCRDSLLRTTIRAHMEKLRDQHGLVGMTRLASVFLIRLCTVETTLYLDFFGGKKLEEGNESNVSDSSKIENSQNNPNQTKTLHSLPSRTTQEDGTCYDKDFQTYLASLTSSLHRTIRRGLVTVLDLDTLCQIVSVLREERSMASSSPTTHAAARSISSVIEDAQERLIFCATNSLTKEVIRFKASPKDLDYPNKLVKKHAESALSKPEGKDYALKKQLQVYESWFPPMRSVLRILSKIFRVVEPKVFEDIALQSVQSCTRSLRDGSKHIEKQSGTIHADLFLVKHLLILREQLSPFNIELRSVERQLDFSDAGRAVSRFLANRNRRLFSMSTENALITLLREGVSINEESVDSKRDLEEALRNVCNGFIDHTCNALAEDIFGLVTLNSSTPESQETTLPFEACKVRGDLSNVLKNFELKATDVLNTMNLYLDNPTTQTILLKPVSKKISKGLEHVQQGINETQIGNNGWNDSIRAETLSIINDLEKVVKKIGRVAK